MQLSALRDEVIRTKMAEEYVYNQLYEGNNCGVEPLTIEVIRTKMAEEYVYDPDMEIIINCGVEPLGQA